MKKAAVGPRYLDQLIEEITTDANGEDEQLGPSGRPSTITLQSPARPRLPAH